MSGETVYNSLYLFADMPDLLQIAPMHNRNDSSKSLSLSVLGFFLFS